MRPFSMHLLVRQFCYYSHSQNLRYHVLGLPADDPRHVQIGEAMNAKARAIQLATFARYDDIPGIYPPSLAWITL